MAFDYQTFIWTTVWIRRPLSKCGLITENSTPGLLLTIQILDSSVIQIPTVFKCFQYGGIPTVFENSIKMFWHCSTHLHPPRCLQDTQSHKPMFTTFFLSTTKDFTVNRLYEVLLYLGSFCYKYLTIMWSFKNNLNVLLFY